MRLSRSFFALALSFLAMGSATLLAACVFCSLALLAGTYEAAWWLFGLPVRLLTHFRLPRGKQ